MNKLYYFLCTLLLASCSVATQQESTSQTVVVTDPAIRYSGRVLHTKDSATIYWSGSGITFRFKGSSAKAWLRDETGNNYFNVVIDGDSIRYIRPSREKTLYALAEGLSDGEHTIELVKRNEWDRGKTWFYGLDIGNGRLLPMPDKNGRIIEFFGNSISAGYAIEDYSGGDSPDSIFTNNYPTYAAITARHFKADYYCTVKSGIGITVSWFPLIMPELYDRLDPADSTSKWPFLVQPDVVVINLLQNDSWLVKMPEHPSFKERFGKTAPDAGMIVKAYADFVGQVRNKYPDAFIICALGSMDATREGSPWPGYVREAVAELDDPRIKTLFFPYTNKPGHPRKEDNEAMAAQLIQFIGENVDW